MKEPLISVIVPVYNVEKYLRKCIDSIVNQSYKNIEIILVDDGSLDNSGLICDEYAKKDSRIKVIHKSNGGLSDARNKGIELAKGQYLTFIDSDDYVTSNYVECLYNLIYKYKTKMSICNVKVIWSNTKKTKKTVINEDIFNSEEVFKKILFDDGVSVSAYAKLYKTDLWSNIRFPVGETYEDSATIYKLIHKSKKVGYSNAFCYFYVARCGSISKMGCFNDNEKYYIKNTDAMLKFIKEKYSKLSLAVDRYYLYSRFRILRILVFTKPRNKKMEKQIISEIKKIQKTIFLLKQTPKRDKIAIIILNLGITFFKISWYLYCKITGRIC